jgi:hypothetical protein
MDRFQHGKQVTIAIVHEAQPHYKTTYALKTDEGIVNELLCKVLCHNMCVVIQSMYELGIEPTFWAKSDTLSIEPTLYAEMPVAHKVPV